MEIYTQAKQNVLKFVVRQGDYTKKMAEALILFTCSLWPDSKVSWSALCGFVRNMLTEAAEDQ